jgi:hypothetical protein
MYQGRKSDTVMSNDIYYFIPHNVIVLGSIIYVPGTQATGTYWRHISGERRKAQNNVTSISPVGMIDSINKARIMIDLCVPFYSPQF